MSRRNELLAQTSRPVSARTSLILALAAALALAILPQGCVEVAAATAPAKAALATPVAVHAILVELDNVIKAVIFVDQYGDVAAVDAHNCKEGTVCASEIDRLLKLDHGVGAIHLDSATAAQHPDQDDRAKTPV
jgi:hypothetical protein